MRDQARAPDGFTLATSDDESLIALGERIAACRICRDHPDSRARPLPHEPRPVCVLSSTARIVICGQAPGTRVHASGRPFTDPSGDRLRTWLGVGEDEFYDPAQFSIVPMGFCFPGLDAKGGDRPPRRECRANWHDSVFAAMPQIDLVLAVGRYAQDYHLPRWRGRSLHDVVQSWDEIAEETARAGRCIIPLPHPSWRNNAWLSRNAWFDQKLVPHLQEEVAARLRHAVDQREH